MNTNKRNNFIFANDQDWNDGKDVLTELREMEEAELDAVDDAAGDPYPNMRKVLR
jgi:hypothetical protein